MDRKSKAPRDGKKALCAELATVIKKLQEDRVVSKRSQSGPEVVEPLCEVIEAIFLHELKNNKGQLWRETKRANSWNAPEPSFWTFVDPLISDEIKMQLYALRNSESDIRKCRSWVRLVMAKGLMLTFMQDLQRHPGLLAFHYGGDAVLRDPEQSEVIIQLLKGLSMFQLECDHTSSRLVSWDPSPLQLAGVWAPPKRMLSQESRGSARISPPASDFDFEGVSLIDHALDRYSKRKADTFTDSQLIQQERLEQQTAVSEGSRGSGSATSLDDIGTPDRSYGALLRSYTRKSTAPAGSAPLGIPGRPGGKEGEGEGEEGDVALALYLNYEVVSSDGSLASEHSESHHNHIQTMTSLLTKLVTEKGLDSQNYHCAGCKRPIGIIFGQAKLCKYNGQHYCFDCHVDDERIIPSRILFNWDFRRHRVCVASCEFLDSIESTPVLNVEEVNKSLYLYIPELEEAWKLRRQLKHLKDYLLTCKERDAADQFRKRVRSSHLYENVHLYSLNDLMEVHSGVLLERMKKAVRLGMKHMKQCDLCSQKGFICEVCHNDQVIYPFDLDRTHQCSKCNALYHKSCQPAKGHCPKCLRVQKRLEALADTANS